ncbi:AraC family transcriptional regulator [Paenibacillus aceris]|uniref:AraC-like DNA-binding protein n=1 Tax=Paenibacillus aceris TaxID=869555 RepID=A0ABS4HVW6_9BACL|nr:AraC family transcriptional regulator [Paenibacillus aceris]MBP1962770.1 AraC-like DNA-binding protein [Paenibacillus aceris]NHW33867.1 AraC family transcriptional regulator [Paenibacillus aceris]
MQEYALEYADYWFSLPHPLQTAGGCWIVRAGQNEAKPNYMVGPKVINQTSIHWILQGKVRVSSNNRTIGLSKGDLFCLFPKQTYTYETIHESDEKPLKMVWLAMEGNQLPYLTAQLGLTTDIFWLQEIVNSEVANALRSILEAVSQPEKDALQEQSLLYDLFWKMNKASTRLAPTRKANWLDDVKDYLDLHATEHIRIEDAARLVGVHRSHLFASFRKKYGVSPQQYLQKIRLTKGASLLRETVLSVTEIALSLGYPELYSFTRSFTKYFGVSPSSYREKMNGLNW